MQVCSLIKNRRKRHISKEEIFVLEQDLIKLRGHLESCFFFFFAVLDIDQVLQYKSQRILDHSVFIFSQKPSTNGISLVGFLYFLFFVYIVEHHSVSVQLVFCLITNVCLIVCWPKKKSKPLKILESNLQKLGLF